jgi:GT2 family glycosyltransferase
MSDEQAPPPVVAVVVTSDPGPWLEDCLAALRSQDYAALSTLVIDAGSTDPLAERIAAIAPEVYLHRLAGNDGFGPSANAALELVEGAAFFLFCHDDIVPDDDAVRRMVEEAFRSNAGIVSPKLVDYHQPDRLLQIGLGVDRFAAPVRRVQPGELDQSQHDEARNVFAAPGACTLIRADLFAAIGGFDRAINMLGEDVDLCWRARLAGARVVVAPAARVRHLEATASRQRPLPDARALQWRHELRAVLKNYGRFHRSVVVAELLVLSFFEAAYFIAVGKRWRARLVLDAWRWNLARRAELRDARRTVAGTRRVSDRTICRAMDGGTFRLVRSARRFAEGSARDRAAHSQAYLDRPSVGSRRAGMPAVREISARLIDNRAALAALLLACAVLVVGCRSLFLGHLPLVGQLLPFPPPTQLLSDFFAGWRDAGMQQTGPASPALGMIGLVGLVIGGGTSLVWKVLIVACVALGGLGAARLVRPWSPVAGRVAAAIAYLFLPLAWDDLARGEVTALVVFAATPWVLASLCDAVARPERSWREQAVGLGLLLALSGSFAPLIVPLTLSMALGLLLATVAASGRAAWRAGVRGAAVAVAGVAVAVALTFPWSITYLQSAASWSVTGGPLQQAGAAPSLSQVLRFDLGPLGQGSLGYAFLLAGLIAVLVGREERLEWGTRFAVLAVLGFAWTWVAGRGLLGPGGGDARALLAPAAACVAACVGLGVAAIATDLAASGFGWRHAAAALCGVAGIAGLLPVIGASGSGRFGVPGVGYDTALSLPVGKGASAGDVLWLGAPEALPLVGWQLAPGLAAGLSEGQPDGTRLFPSPSAGLMRVVGGQVLQAEGGLTVTLAVDLAAENVRYVVVTTATAPVLPDIQTATATPPPPRLVEALVAQEDLHRLTGGSGAIVFENTAWRGPSVAGLSPAGGTPSALREIGLALALALALIAGGWSWRRRRSGQRRGRATGAHRPGGRRAHELSRPGPQPGEQFEELVLSAE